MTQPYILSIETEPGKSHQHGFHLGTDLRVARQIAEETFHARAKLNMPVVTVALIRGAKLVDTYYGNGWHSDFADAAFAE
jgi:hypothetical protein